MKYATIIFLLLLVLVSQCKKKESELLDNSWKYVGEGQGRKAQVYNNELFIFDKYDYIIYRINSEGKIIEQRTAIYQNSSNANEIYSNCYLTHFYNFANSYIPNSVDSSSIFVNSYTDPGSRILLSNVSGTDTSFINGVTFSDNLDSLTKPGIFAYIQNTKSYTPGVSFIHYDYTIDPNSGKVLNAYVNNRILLPDGISQTVFGFNNSYISTSDSYYNNSNYIIYSNGNFEKLDNCYYPQFVYKDTLYGKNQFDATIYKTADCKNWIVARVLDNPYVNYKFSVVDNRIIDLGSIKEYDLITNKFTQLNTHGLPLAYADFIVLFNGYYYISCSNNIYRIKQNFL
jgi:hypothetical protein